MEYLTRAEFLDWVSNPSTKKVRHLVMQKVFEESMRLAQTCGKDQMYDRYRSGLLKGMELAYDFDTLFEGYDIAEEKPNG